MYNKFFGVGMQIFCFMLSLVLCTAWFYVMEMELDEKYAKLEEREDK
jgi:hypothetical protein